MAISLTIAISIMFGIIPACHIHCLGKRVRVVLRDVVRALKRLVIETWNKDELDKSRATLAAHAEEIIQIIIDDLKAESDSPPKQCCGKRRVREVISIYSFVPAPKRKKPKP